MEVGDVTGGTGARFCDLRLRPESCISYSRPGGFVCQYEVRCALVVTGLRASNVLLFVLNGVPYGQHGLQMSYMH